ncbi:MAG: chemotaxis protein CheW [Acidobacteriota bacterium]
MTDGREGAPAAPEPGVPELRVAPVPVRWDLPRSERVDDPVPSAERRQRVILRFGEQRVAIDAEHAKAVRSVERATPVPRTPPYVLGVAAVQGRILPVVELAGALGAPPVAGPPWTGLVVDAAGFTVVLAVDEVVDRELVDPTDPSATPSLDLAHLLSDLRPTPRARSPIR